MYIKTKEISGIASAVYDMRKPMASENDSKFLWDADGLTLVELGVEDKKLLTRLGRAKGGSGHDCVLKDMVVHMDMKMTHDFMLQFYRYHFRDTASSTSKMHCIHKGDISDKCTSFVLPAIIEYVNALIEVYNNVDKHISADELAPLLTDCVHANPQVLPTTKKELFECIIHNTPMGYMLTVGEVTNYLQLKSMYNQRKTHKMSAWSVIFVEWVKTLPYSFLITGAVM